MIFNVGAGNGGSVVYVTQAEYDALPDSKLTNNIEYRIIDGNADEGKASNLSYDNSFSGLEAVNVQTAIDKVNESLSNVKTYVGEDGKLHFVDSEGADTVLPFSSLSFKRLSASVIPFNTETLVNDNAFMSVSASSPASGQAYIAVTINGVEDFKTTSAGTYYFSVPKGSKVSYRTNHFSSYGGYIYK